MLNIRDKIIELRKAKNWSQSDLAKAIEASRDINGKYKRNENIPSIEMAFKIAKVFDVPVDYLLGEGKYSTYENDTEKRIEHIQVLNKDTKTLLFNLIDTNIQNFKTQKAISK